MNRLPISWFWAAGSAAAMVVGAIGPWVKATLTPISRTASGIDGGDGWIVAGAAGAAALLLLAYLVRPRRSVAVLVMLAACAAGATAGYDLGTPNLISSPLPIDESREWGIYLAAAASASLFLASLGLFIQTRRPSE